MIKESTIIPVRGYHLDGYKHVNNARYLEFLEEARWQYLDNISAAAYVKLNCAFVIVNININYRFSATFGDVLRVESEIGNIGNTSVSFKQEIFLGDTDKLICDAVVTFVVLNQKTGKPFKIEGDLKALLLKKISM